MSNLFRIEEAGFQLDLPLQYPKVNLSSLKLHSFDLINSLCFHTDDIQQVLIDLFSKLAVPFFFSTKYDSISKTHHDQYMYILG